MDPETHVLLQCRRFRVEQTIERPEQGGARVREIIRHPGAVVILPLADSGHVCLIRNFRPAVNQTLIELPAGTREPQETPDQTAARELREETGYCAGRLEPVARFYPSPGIMDEQMILYVARELQAGEPQREAGEHIENLVVPFDTALGWVIDGTIQDSKTICGLTLWHLSRSASSGSAPAGHPAGTIER